MSENENRIIKNYANALVQVSGDKMPKILSELLEIEKVFENNKKLTTTLDDPSVPSKDQNAFIETISKGTNVITKNFLRTLADNRHFNLLERIVILFNDLVEKSQNHNIVLITSAVELSKKEIEKLKKISEARFEIKHVEIQNKIDPMIIGGVILTAGGKTIDGSLRNELSTIKRHLQNKEEFEEERSK